MMGSELKTAKLCVMAAKLLSLGLLVSHSPTRCAAHVKAEGINLESNSGCSGSTLEPECGPVCDGKV